MTAVDADRETAAPTPPAPWGSPPTPLLPRWYFERFPNMPLPPALISTIPRETPSAPLPYTIADLAQYWESHSTPFSQDQLTILISQILGFTPPHHQVVLRQGTHLERLLLCPLGTRAHNCVGRGINQGLLREGERLTVGNFLAIPNFGHKSLIELLCLVEAATENHYLFAPIPPLTNSSPAAQGEDSMGAGGSKKQKSPQVLNPDGGPDEAWQSAIPVLQKLLGASLEFGDARTLREALERRLGDLAAALGLSDDLEGLQIADLTSGSTLADDVLSAAATFLNSLAPMEQRILKQRRLATPTPTLEEIGREFNLTRERIRQIDNRLWKELVATLGHRINTIAALVYPSLEPILAEDVLAEKVQASFPSNGVRDKEPPSTLLARQLLREALDYTCDDHICLSAEAIAVRDALRDAAHTLADDVGLIEEAELQASLPSEDWMEHWDVLVSRCSLVRLSDHLALRDIQKARTKAALLAIGHPATKSEIAQRANLSEIQVGNKLCELTDVVRADKSRWGMADWVEDEYEGIPAEIIQRINEDGGATRLARLIEELPRMFGVTESSVRSYVGTPKFDLRDGFVSLADVSTIRLRPLGDVIDGRTVSGTPYWLFRVEQRYFDGYSLAGVPPEILSYLACEPDGRKRIWLTSPGGCGPLSLGWRLASVAGGYIGYLAEPLRRLGARAGDMARLVLDRPDSVSLQLGDNFRPDAGGPPTRPISDDGGAGGGHSLGLAKPYLERLQARRGF